MPGFRLEPRPWSGRRSGVQQHGPSAPGRANEAVGCNDRSTEARVATNLLLRLKTCERFVKQPA